MMSLGISCEQTVVTVMTSRRLLLPPPPPPPSPTRFGTPAPLQAPLRRAQHSSTPILDHFMPNPAPAFTPTSRKRSGAFQYSKRAKMPRNSSHIKIQIYSAQHHVTGTKPNVELFHDSANTLDSILTQIMNRRSDARNCRLIIFISDFQLCPSDSVHATIDKIDRIYNYVESHGHLVSFAYLAMSPRTAWTQNVKQKPPPTRTSLTT